MKNYIFLNILLIFCSCSTQPCENLQGDFNSYNEVLGEIEKNDFNFTDKVNTSLSSWITNASFYSCNKKDGYFILETAERGYIFMGVPMAIWNDFKKAESFGSYYNQFIRGRYRLMLEN